MATEPHARTSRWEDVLAHCEATAAAAEALLLSRNGLDVSRFEALTALDLWQLSLPPLPDHLLDRARSIHSRQFALQAKMVAAMTQLQQQIQLTESAEPFDYVARYLDRSA
jgi:hypothetical protein